VRSANEVLVTVAVGVSGIFRFDGRELVEIESDIRPADRIWEVGGALALAGPFHTAVWDGDDWRDATTEEQRAAYEEASGCGADEEDGELEDRDPDEAEERPSTPLSPWPDRTIDGWLAALGERGRALEPWRRLGLVEHRADDGASWVATSSHPEPRLYARIDSALRTLSMPARATAVALQGRTAWVALADRGLARVALGAEPMVQEVLALESDVASILALEGGDAVVLASNGDVFAVRGSSVTRAHALGRPMRAIAGDTARMIAVGPRGAVSIGTLEAGFTSVPTHITAPLRAIAIDGDRIVVAGAGGTVVVIEGGVARALPRRTVEDLVEVRVLDGAIYARTDDGAVVRMRDGNVEWRYRHLRPEHALATMRWAPDASPVSRGGPREASLSFEPLTSPIAIALDEPGSILPYELIASRLYRHRIGARYRREPGDRPGIAVQSELDDELERLETYCCEGDGGDYEPTGIGHASGCVDEPEWDGCALSSGMMLGLDPIRGVAVRIARAGEASDCEPLRVEEVQLRDSRVVRSSDPYGCRDGQRARDRALWEYLLDPRFESFEAWTERPISELPGADDGDVLALHRTSGADEILLVQEDNRRSATLWRIPHATAGEGWGRIDRVFQSGDGRWTWLETTIGNEEIRWMGATPPGLRDAAGARPDVSTCTSLVVADPDGETTLRSVPTSRSTWITTLPNGTELTAGRRRQRWIEVLPPHAGWVYDANVRCR
jgi:hypothetical protein